MTKLNLHLADESAQLALAARIARQCPAGAVIFLHGDLGTGKTTFVRGFLQALGHQGVVKSPTYTLVEPYLIDHKHIYHFDLYRLADPDELEYAGGRDYFNDQAICLLEWPEKAEGYLPQADLILHLSYRDSGRDVIIESGSDLGETLLGSLNS
ncbi:MAG: tRNA (adenosine(37)-N6)-threonylcarbamoyltransferase complex ATPase subunit type 1 TsaE [Gammaproteobacteria bacterium]|nr:tRNA (adenosine(37)-N6)-threonylcarbamoyltransferase complex ATPase subunit type 1 TsaE [Gammaproteobacteria bacterium]MCW8909312.1 tRNA (adenosine(37)-N6)-threonylcarbamoyltransferase complex ATPase subunit type 1 TsaE [Gammaproteobacteria bacterium]MCW9006030.1 tRNA (adenosine(37)-N6)-threonylcarbamoyltransferase complex ATPase subunit type 1 TsaE [Gammaproteobacteria bacterium]MCW9057204.1 tRNA (adenosine(37)-N6)-threonylcarbamoyltransferase complex ATPase subunit type 1 TsaE [Gammaproteob